MVRMWMVEPGRMCNKHLRGEYVECLMIAGLMRKEIKLDGWIAHNCIEPLSVVDRFAALKKEMLARGYRAVKELPGVEMDYLPREAREHRIDRKKNELLLRERCGKCDANFASGKKG
jgi:hypothetical protein